MTFPSHSWDPASRTGYRTAVSSVRKFNGEHTLISKSDRPRRFWRGVLKGLTFAEYETIDDLYFDSISSSVHGGVTLTDPWVGDAYEVVFTARPSYTEAAGVYEVTVDLEEEDTATRTISGVGDAYPSIQQNRGCRKVPVDVMSARRTSYGSVVVHNLMSQRRDRYQVAHDLLTPSDLETLMDHYEANWREAIDLDFDLTSETGVSVRYVRPPEITQIEGLFRVSNLLEAA